MDCERCHTPTLSYTMSRFNTQNICLDCEAKERAHPKYETAVRIEAEHVRQGDYNFPGIGLPDDESTH